jgi:hypothetical protein
MWRGRGRLSGCGLERCGAGASRRAAAAAMPTRNLGKTGYRVAVFSLGGQAALERPNNDAVAVPIVERALELGVNYKKK